MLPSCLFIPLINQIHYNFHHYVFLLGATFGNHQREGHKGIVGNAFGAIGAVKDTVVIQEPKEQSSSYTLVTIAKRMVLGDQIEKHGGFLFHLRR